MMSEEQHEISRRGVNPALMVVGAVAVAGVIVGLYFHYTPPAIGPGITLSPGSPISGTIYYTGGGSFRISEAGAILRYPPLSGADVGFRLRAGSYEVADARGAIVSYLTVTPDGRIRINNKENVR